MSLKPFFYEYLFIQPKIQLQNDLAQKSLDLSIISELSLVSKNWLHELVLVDIKFRYNSRMNKSPSFHLYLMSYHAMAIIHCIGDVIR